MTRKLTVKREIRTLGLDLCNPRRLVAAVVRGGHYLDGVLVFSSKPILRSSSIASAILKTRFFPELRLIMTHDPEMRLKPRLIERLTNLPVIEVDSKRKTRSAGFEPYSVRGRNLHAKTSLQPRTLQEILLTTWTMGMLPEPLRIAHLIARSRFFRKKHAFSS
jgi:endonuclease V-like protein UPF0215 family